MFDDDDVGCLMFDDDDDDDLLSGDFDKFDEVYDIGNFGTPMLRSASSTGRVSKQQVLWRERQDALQVQEVDSR